MRALSRPGSALLAAGSATVVVRRQERWLRMAAAGTGLAALAVYLRPGLAAPGAHWPLWDARVYWWGGQRAARGGALYAPGARYSFTYPPFAAVIFSVAARAPEGWLAAVITAGSASALAVLCALALGAAGMQRRPETVFAASALALLTWPVAYTLHLGEIDLIVAALAGADLLRRREGRWWQGIALGLAAGIKLTPLIFVVFLLITGRVRAAVTAAGTFAATVALGAIVLPSQSRTYWLAGVFWRQDRIGNPANPSDQSLAGAVARLAGTGHPAQACWLAAALVTGLAGMAIAAWAHRRSHQLAAVICCAITGLLISPFSWTHHWVWAVPLLVTLTATALRRRSPWYGLAAAAAAAVFSGYLPLPAPGHPLSPGRLLQGDLYVLCGLTVLAGAAVALARDSAAWQTRQRKAHNRTVTSNRTGEQTPAAQLSKHPTICPATSRSNTLAGNPEPAGHQDRVADRRLMPGCPNDPQWWGLLGRVRPWRGSR